MWEEDFALNPASRMRSAWDMPRPTRPSILKGNDTAHKLALLASLAFGTQIAADDIYLEGISNISLADIRAADELIATASSFLVLHRRPIPASNSAYIRPWCQPLRLLRRFMV